MYNSYNDKKDKWNDLFKNEEELVEALKQIDVNKFNQLCNRYIVKGYQYIESFVKRVNAGRDLTPAQMRQLKRLAREVKVYHEAKHLVRG